MCLLRLELLSTCSKCRYTFYVSGNAFDLKHSYLTIWLVSRLSKLSDFAVSIGLARHSAMPEKEEEEEAGSA
ncbi:unnamed protein product [Mesocestoides corti]|uniref:Uncharacterized protein n=1 Tax=Mesocestoides corti TaxID=53468 RepID=A0A0R3UDI4_MESCO|nr:unnamed protein product [Mesocestoides corti]